MHDKYEENAAASFSSPTSAVSSEETRILTEYISQKNLFKITSQDETRRKSLTLKQFFKMKRNQQVVITSAIENDGSKITEGKVATIGRDFVMVTDVQKRIWIPYKFIDSATIPFGFPTYSNTHQHFIYDNHLQQKLVLQFGETVVKKEALIRQFFEESLQTNLLSWRGMWVEVKTAEKIVLGKLDKTTTKELFLQLFNTTKSIPLHDIHYISTIGFFALWKQISKALYKKLKNLMTGDFHSGSHRK
jgi:2-succinyl-5-enolpyruvyl-6-hydroxy-3-cyclohexene-1-carboxylate synthase